MKKIVCGVDFGTSNSTMGVNDGSNIQLIPFTQDTPSIPSVLLWSKYENEFFIGNRAIEEFTDQAEGRFFRSLKRYLGEIEEISTLIGHRTMSAKRYFLTDLIALLLADLKKHTETQQQCVLDTVMLGRPVRYNDDDEGLDQQAQTRMEKAARQAGYKTIEFQYEPVAAALSYENTLTKDEYVLVGDIGGGTSDFSIVRVGPSYQNKTDRKDDILGNAGVYVGGDTFDRQIVYEDITPLMGRGSKYHTGTKMLEIPTHLFLQASQWHLIHFLKDQHILKQIQDYITFSEDPVSLKRFQQFIEHDLGVELFNAVEQLKISLTQESQATLQAEFFSAPFQIQKTRAAFEESSQTILSKIETGLKEVIAQSALPLQRIDSVSLVGGSTLIPCVRKIFSQYFNPHIISNQNVFTSIGYGLSLAAKKLL